MTAGQWMSFLTMVGAIPAGALLFTRLPSNPSFGRGTFDPHPKTAQEAVEQLVWANRILANEGIFDAFGHVSVRNPEDGATLFIARAIAPETVTKNDILEIDLEGNVLTKTQVQPYLERIIHGAIFKARPDVQSIIHAHPVPVVTLSVSEVPFRIVSHTAAIFYEGVPLFDEYDFTSPNPSGMLVQTKEDGDRVATKLGKSMAMLMWGHGCNVVGTSIPGAIRAAIALRDNAVIQLAAGQHGQVRSLTHDQARAATGTMTGESDRAWNAWVERVKRTMPVE
jgi:ribulose-5-phosphate 4-epimerase/fuculose-1-phosphate aldolase